MRFSPEESFDPEICIRCGRCSTVCPSGAVVAGADGIPSFDHGRCISCGHCAAFCPPDSFHIGTQPGKLSDSRRDLLDLLSRRRSIRQFDGSAISDEDLASLLEVAGYSPTGTNACGIRIRVFRNERAGRLHMDARRALRPLWCSGLLRLAGAVSGMTPFLKRFMDGDDLIFRQAPLVLFFFAPAGNPTARDDGVIAASLVMVAAESMGLGSFWNGIAKILYSMVPRWKPTRSAGGRIRLCAVLCLGRPLYQGRAMPPRDWVLEEDDPEG